MKQNLTLKYCDELNNNGCTAAVKVIQHALVMLKYLKSRRQTLFANLPIVFSIFEPILNDNLLDSNCLNAYEYMCRDSVWIAMSAKRS